MKMEDNYFTSQTVKKSLRWADCRGKQQEIELMNIIYGS